MEFPPTSCHRIAAGIEFLLWQVSQEGHVCLPNQELLSSAKALLEVDENLIELELENQINQQKLICKEIEGRIYYWVKPLYQCEIGIARELVRLKEESCCIRTIDTEKAIEWVQQKMHLRLAPCKKMLSLQAARRKFI